MWSQIFTWSSAIVAGALTTVVLFTLVMNWLSRHTRMLWRSPTDGQVLANYCLDAFNNVLAASGKPVTEVTSDDYAALAGSMTGWMVSHRIDHTVTPSDVMSAHGRAIRDSNSIVGQLAKAFGK